MTIATHIVSLLLVVVVESSLFDSDVVARDEVSASAVSAHPLRLSAIAIINIHFMLLSIIGMSVPALSVSQPSERVAQGTFWLFFSSFTLTFTYFTFAHIISFRHHRFLENGELFFH